MSRLLDPMRITLLAALVTAAGESQAAPAQLRCATPDPSPKAVLRCQLTVERYLQRYGFPEGGGVIGVVFHVVRCDGAGDVSAAQIEAQIAELNRAFQGSGYRFRLDRVDRTDNCRWFRMTPGSGEERSAKHALAIDPARRLNVYSCELAPFLLGWAYLPDHFPEEHFMHGVVLQRSAMPGGAFEGFEQGRSAVHEVGHYLGLYHTFQNGCESPGDVVEDTPYQRDPAFGCPPGRNTCPQPGDDPVGNYMDYADDRCMVSFTAGQGERMRVMVPAYRPRLIAAPLAGGGPEAGVPARPVPSGPAAAAATRIAPSGAGTPAGEVPTSALAFQGASPNPFCDQTTLRFTLPERSWVQLSLRAGLGKHVRTLVSRRLEAGSHEVRLDAGALRSGVYVAELEACGTKETRIVVLER